PAKVKQLLADAGYPNGFEAGDFYCDAPFANIAEAVLNSLVAAGIRATLRPIERAAFFKGYAEKRFKGLIMGASGAFGNAATRLEAFVVKGGAYAYGSYPDVDALFQQQAVELNRERRKTMLDKIQQLVVEHAVFAPIWQLAALHGVGPRVARRRGVRTCLRRIARGSRRRAARSADLGRPRLARADLVRPGRNAGDRHPVHGALRIA